MRKRKQQGIYFIALVVVQQPSIGRAATDTTSPAPLSVVRLVRGATVFIARNFIALAMLLVHPEDVRQPCSLTAFAALRIRGLGVRRYPYFATIALKGPKALFSCKLSARRPIPMVSTGSSSRAIRDVTSVGLPRYPPRPLPPPRPRPPRPRAPAPPPRVGLLRLRTAGTRATTS
jgi:hypothetical protein